MSSSPASALKRKRDAMEEEPSVFEKTLNILRDRQNFSRHPEAFDLWKFNHIGLIESVDCAHTDAADAALLIRFIEYVKVETAGLAWDTSRADDLISRLSGIVMTAAGGDQNVYDHLMCSWGESDPSQPQPNSPFSLGDAAVPLLDAIPETPKSQMPLPSDFMSPLPLIENTSASAVADSVAPSVPLEAKTPVLGDSDVFSPVDSKTETVPEHILPVKQDLRGFMTPFQGWMHVHSVHSIELWLSTDKIPDMVKPSLVTILRHLNDLSAVSEVEKTALREQLRTRLSVADAAAAAAAPQ
jgi:hypothetical protein